MSLHPPTISSFVFRVLCSARHKGTNISNVHGDVKRENTHEQREERKDWREMKQRRGEGGVGGRGWVSP